MFSLAYHFYGIFVFKRHIKHPAPIITSSYRNHSNLKFICWDIFLKKNTVYNFVQCPITTNNNKLSIAFFNITVVKEMACSLWFVKIY